jgi:predicted AlkP superfamily phosphohydrolase/phosphomutase
MKKKRAMVLGLDGADPLVIKKLADAGRLPNLKRIMDEGVMHDDMAMIGAIPSVTPTNWASLATGNWPRTHGVTCYDNHTLGLPLDRGELNWDSRRVESELIWEAFASDDKRCIMMNYCEAWPPRQTDDKNIFIDGTGVVPFMRSAVDYQKIVWMEQGDFPIEESLHDVKSSTADCVVTADQFEQMKKENNQVDEEESLFEPMVEHDLKIVPPFGRVPPKDSENDTIRTPLKSPENWGRKLSEDALVAVVPLNNDLVRRYFVVEGDTITVYKNRKADGPVLGTVRRGEWSDQIRDVYMKDDQQVRVCYRMRWIAGQSDGNKKIKLYISNAQSLDDTSYTWPRDVGQKLLNEVGPNVSFAKYGQAEKPDWEDNDIMLESFYNDIEWHSKATHWLFNKFPDWDLYYIHLHGIDLYNHWYLTRTLPGTDPNWEKWQEYLYGMYEAHDAYIGEMLKYCDDDTAIFVVSDHAAVPHVPSPGLGGIPGITYGVLEDLGYTKMIYNENGVATGVDWSQTKAVCQRSSYIYVNLKGRDPNGIVEPEDYEQTVKDIISDVYSYRYPETGERVVSFCMTREEMEMLGVGGPHVGDILVQLVPKFGMEHANCPSNCTYAGHSMRNLCMMIGGGFKKSTVINRVIRITDVVPTICYMTGTRMPSNVDGGVIWQALEGFEEKEYAE